jgi:hypothetical protein
MNGGMELNTTSNGASFPFLSYLKTVLQREQPTQDEIELKLAFDAATMTTGKRIQQEIGTFELLLPHHTISQIKSPSSAHQWMIYFGTETRGNVFFYLLQFFFI